MDREAALQELPQSYAVALRLRDRGVSEPEIAEIVGISLEGVSAHLRLAEAKLARLLAADHEGAP
jgi:DNA-directed RNA polymerase specialized sigma24 family protein